jgi:calcineurin-like phosphoesterase family protein
MSRVYCISDLHFGHKKILQFSERWREGSTVEEHDEILVAKWNSVVGKRDLVFVLGDVAFSRTVFHTCMPQLAGRKVLVRGNHDELQCGEYLQYFEDVRGIFKKNGHWFSHAPVHPAELRGCKNIHGHVHHNTVRDHYHEVDERYINVCVEACDGFPIDFEEIKAGEYKPKC